MKSFLKILLLLLLPAFVQAQQQHKQLDSLRTALSNAANDTIRMDVYDQLVYYFAEVNADTSLLYAEKELQTARQLNLKIYELNALIYQGYAFISLSNYPKALESFLKAQKIGEDPACENTVWHFSNSLTPHEVRIGLLNTNQYFLGVLYATVGNRDKQIASFLNAKSYAESIRDTAAIGFVYWQLGGDYQNRGKLDSALLFAQKTLFYFSKYSITFNSRRYGGRTYVGGVYNSIGDIYQRKGNFDSSLSAFRKAEQINIETNNPWTLGYSYAGLSNLFLTAKKADTSLFYANKALETFKGYGDFFGIAYTYKTISSAYAQQNKPNSAFAYLTLSTNIYDSLNNVQKRNLLAYQNVGFDEQLRLKKLEEDSIQTQNKIRTYAMLAGIVVFMLIAFLLYRNNRNRKKANELLQKQKEEIGEQKKHVEKTLTELRSTQAQLIQSEKMASLGELTAGIAHEIQNPLNFVNNFSEVNKEMLEELKAERLKPKEERDEQTEAEIIEDVIANEEKINHHGKRADAIVKGMLQHSQSTSGIKELTDINKLADEYVRLAYHGLQAKDKSFNVTLKTDFDEAIGNINIIPQDIGRVVLNLINNAFYVVDEKKKSGIEGYEPTVSVSTKKVADKVLISLRDNGNGIPQKIVDKIFQPFFTTKPTGQGTGLGLSLAYDIVKAHGGELKVETKEGEGSEFIIQLPKNKN
jgi:two-component system, NtrC family, sensor kinase